MDTISRENNSMLPVGGIIVGVIALLLGGYSAISLSKVNKSLADHQAKIDKIDGIEAQATAAADKADKAKAYADGLGQQTQKAFTDVGGYISELRASVTKLEEASKKPAAAAAKKGATGSSEPVVAGPGEYVVKAGDTSGTKIAKANGVSIEDLKAVNPGIEWNHLKIGQKLKLPSKK
jgi:LysM repeat protein